MKISRKCIVDNLNLHLLKIFTIKIKINNVKFEAISKVSREKGSFSNLQIPARRFSYEPFKIYQRV